MNGMKANVKAVQGELYFLEKGVDIHRQAAHLDRLQQNRKHIVLKVSCHLAS